MVEEYTTVSQFGVDEFIEKRSRFISYCKPVKTQEEAEEFIAEIRSKHWDARHNVFAYVLSENNIMRASDDGEPQGTAGVPVLDAIRKSGIVDVIVVVTRYFGGVLLGTGGLVRAYSQAVKEGLAHCRIGMKRPGCELEIQTDYNGIGKILYLLGQRGLEPTESIYTDTVTLHILIPAEDEEQMRKEITEATFGKAGIEKKWELFYIEKM